MILSIKLLVASLGVSQFSSVVGSKEAREKLRNNLRQGERKTQFKFTDDNPGLDDYFAIPEEVEEVGIREVDDFFQNTDTGMVYDWDAAEDTHGHEALDIVHEHENEGPHTHAVATKAGKGKSTKLGKDAWEHAPVELKGSKKDKALKAAKSLTMKGAKGAVLAKAKAGKSGKYTDPRVVDYYSSVSGDDHVDHHEEESADGWLSAFEPSSGALTYGDLFDSTTEVTESHEFADPGHVTSSQFNANGGSGLMTARMGDPEGPSARTDTFDDDYFNPQERLVFLPRPTVTLSGSLFSVNPQTIIPPVVPDGSGDTTTLGTQYLFNEIMSNAQDIGSQISPISVDSEQVLFVVALDGYCDRTGPADQNSVQGYCFFTYTFIDPATSLTAGSFAAQGIIVNAQVPGQLTVTGGTGVMTGAAGLVEILPAAVDQNVNPPELIQPAAGLDPFNQIAGWAHFFEFDVDVLFFLPELYAR